MYFKRQGLFFTMLPFSFVSVLLVGWLYCWVVADEETKFVDVQGEPLSQGTDKGMAYANFVLHKFSFLNITSIGSNHVVTGSECGFACVDIPSCFSFNLAAFHDIDGKVLCELLPSDIYNNSDKLIPSQSHHHYSIASPCISWPCQNNGKCAAQHEKNSYVCVCANGYIGEHCGTDIDECSASIRLCDVNANCQNSYGYYSCSCKSGFSGNGKTCQDIDECSASIWPCDVNANFQNTNGSYSCFCKSGFIGNGKKCQDTNGWTLIARFSNSDSKNWMHDDGKWWYDQQITIGATKNSSENNDMISTAFWSVSGSEIKITRSDDPSHTPLLQTTNNCLGGQAFRSKITSYGDFRNGTVWASDQCLGSCAAQYGGQYIQQMGFKRLSAVETSKVPTRSASGVTGVLVMGQ